MVALFFPQDNIKSQQEFLHYITENQGKLSPSNSSYIINLLKLEANFRKKSIIIMFNLKRAYKNLSMRNKILDFKLIILLVPFVFMSYL